MAIFPASLAMMFHSHTKKLVIGKFVDVMFTVIPGERLMVEESHESTTISIRIKNKTNKQKITLNIINVFVQGT